MQLTVAEPTLEVVLLDAPAALDQEPLHAPLSVLRLLLPGETHALAPLGLERARGREQGLALEVVEHDDVGPGEDGLAGLGERLALDLDPEGEARDGARRVHGRRDGACRSTGKRVRTSIPAEGQDEGRTDPWPRCGCL